jgi:hypothetical protein
MRDEAHIIASGETPRMPQHAVVISGTSWVAGAQRRLGLAGQTPPGDMHVKAVADQPGEAAKRRHPAARPALQLVHGAAVVIDRDAHAQPAGMAPVQREQRLGLLHHRPHRVGQHQRLEAAAEHVCQHRRQVRVHERIAAGEADLLGAEAKQRRLVEIFADFGRREIDEAVVPGRGFDIAVAAGQVAQGSGVEPQGAQLPQRDRRPLFALGRDARVAKLCRVERTRSGRRGRAVDAQGSLLACHARSITVHGSMASSRTSRRGQGANSRGA